MDKHHLAKLMEEIALFLELKGENPFKVRAYQSAAREVEHFHGTLEELLAAEAAGTVKGIGKTIRLHLAEYLAHGRVEYHDRLKEAIPPVLFELVEIPGLGPKKALQLHEKLHIQSIGELEYACRENRLLSLSGFGEKTQKAILQGIEYQKQFQGQFRLGDVLPVAEKLAEEIEKLPQAEKAQVAGSLRRGKETVKDMDLVVASREPEPIMDWVAGLSMVKDVLAKGSTKTSVLLTNGMQLDIRVVAPEEYVHALHHFTGSKEHHVQLRHLAKQQGLSINEYGIMDSAGQVSRFGREAQIYEKVGLCYIPPELREGKDELQAAGQGALPKLVEYEDIAGVFHAHTVDSDGAHTLEEMAQGTMERGWSYLGITDHSQTAVYAGGLKVEAIEKQRKAIGLFNESHPEFTIFSGIESDILSDGQLDYPDDILAQFDFVIASVHSAFRQSKEEMTRRILKAMENKYVSMLGHATGRILLAREGYALDMEAVLKQAAVTGTIMEINSNPYRLDLDWRWCRKAKEMGILLSVNPDAHSLEELDYVRYGLMTARKGWLEKADLVNTCKRDEVLKALQRKRK